MGTSDKKQEAEAERARQLRLVDALMEQGVSFADPARVDIRGELICGEDVFIDINAGSPHNIHPFSVRLEENAIRGCILS